MPDSGDLVNGTAILLSSVTFIVQHGFWRVMLPTLFCMTNYSILVSPTENAVSWTIVNEFTCKSYFHMASYFSAHHGQPHIMWLTRFPWLAAFVLQHILSCTIHFWHFMLPKVICMTNYSVLVISAVALSWNICVNVFALKNNFLWQPLGVFVSLLACYAACCITP